MKGRYRSLCSHIPCTSWTIPFAPEDGLHESMLISRPSAGDLILYFLTLKLSVPRVSIKAEINRRLPAGKYGWRPEVEQVPEKIRELNARLRKYALERGIAWVDYHPALAAEDGSMRTEYTRDGVHPTRAGYDVMEQVIAPALEPYQSPKP